MITLEEATKIARKETGEWCNEEIMTPYPEVYETSEYWLFEFVKEGVVIIGPGPTLVYKADGRVRSVGSREIPEVYKNATPVKHTAKLRKS